MYSNTAHIYDAIYSKLDYPAFASQVAEAVHSHHPDPKTLLEVGCGTGLLLAELDKRFSVQGLDVTPEMLEICQQRLPSSILHEANMVDFDLGTEFDVVACLFSSIGYTGEVALMNQAVKQMAAHLADPGVLVIDPWILPELWRDGYLPADFVDEQDIKIARFGHSRREGRRTIMEMHHLVSTAAGVDYLVATHELYMFSDEEYRRAFAAAGLNVEFIEGGLVGRGMYVGWR